MSWRERVVQAAVLGLALASVSAIGRLADPPRAGAPAIEKPAAVPAPRAGAGKAPGVALRLVDHLKSAEVDAPELGRVDKELEYWRRMRSPWAGPGGELGRAVQQVSLVRGRGLKGKQEIGGGAVWIPDPKVWNMDDGSFDQREAILAPPPATLRFKALAIPPGAVLETAPAIAGPGLGGVEFEVALREPGGERVVLGVRSVEGGRTASFEDWQLSLEKWGGKSVELELTTRAKLRNVPAVAAYWGTPTVFAPSASELPFNVLFIVVDALRGDALASAHDDETDALMAKADPPPLDAWLPRLPEVAPNLDELSKGSVHFTRAYSGGTWTRPGTLAMLSGALSSEVGMPVLPLIPAPADVQALYARRPPFLPLLFRERGAYTRAIVNNFYLVGYAGVGVDMGFEGLLDHRYHRQDTEEIVRDTARLLEQHRSRRFFFFVNFVSPHSPFQPPPSAKAAIPRPPRGPEEKLLRDYLAEINKDDAAIGGLLEKLDELGLTDETLVVVTADHGETLSRDHDAVPDGVDGGPRISGRFHHLSSLYDETAHVPLILRLPKKLPAGKRVTDPVSTLDIAPTLLELAGLEVPSTVRGSSLLPLARGKSDPERVVVTEGRGAHAIRVGTWRLVVRDKTHRHVWAKGRRIERALELYDLAKDPGERVEVAAKHPEVVARLLEADQRRRERAPVASDTKAPKYYLRFAGGHGHRLKGTITASASGGGPAKLSVARKDVPASALVETPGKVELSLELPPEGVVGLDLTLDPPNADLAWSFSVDDRPWPADRVFAGSWAMAAPDLGGGIRGDAAKKQVAGSALPYMDVRDGIGLYVLRDRGAREFELDASDAAKAEAMGLMKAWGYVR